MNLWSLKLAQNKLIDPSHTLLHNYHFCLQLLDCFVIPVLMGLSWWILKARYRLIHSVAVCICLLGVGAMVGADLLAGRDQGSSKEFSKEFTH